MRLRALRVALPVAAVLSIASSGCFRITLVNGTRTPKNGYGAMDDQWRSATVLDAVDVDGAASLDGLCKETGWATIRQVHSPLNWAVDVFLAGGLVYESSKVDIHCAKGAEPPPTGAPGTPGVTPTPSQPAPTPTQPPGVTPTPSQPPPSQPPPVSL